MTGKERERGGERKREREWLSRASHARDLAIELSGLELAWEAEEEEDHGNRQEEERNEEEGCALDYDSPWWFHGNSASACTKESEREKEREKKERGAKLANGESRGRRSRDG